MGGRKTLYTNPVCILCCCGGLPFLALIKGLLGLIPFVVIVPIPIFFMALVASPMIFFSTYKTLLLTPRLGPNIKVLGFILLYIPLILWPFVALLAAIIGSLGFGFFVPAAATFDRDENVIYGGFWKLWKKIPKIWAGFWKYAWKEVSRDLTEWQVPTERYQRFDIPLGHIPVGVFLAIFGCLFLGGLGTVLLLIKMLPMLLMGLYYYIKFWLEADAIWKAVTFLFWIVGFPIVIAGILLGDVLGCVLCFFYGSILAIKPYKYGFGGAFRWQWNQLVELDKFTNKILSFDCHLPEARRPEVIDRRPFLEPIRPADEENPRARRNRENPVATEVRAVDTRRAPAAVTIDPKKIEFLVNAGYPRAAAQRALERTGNDENQALELLTNEDVTVSESSAASAVQASGEASEPLADPHPNLEENLKFLIEAGYAEATARTALINADYSLEQALVLLENQSSSYNRS